MSRAVLRASGLALAACTLLASEARADILGSPCRVDTLERYLGERCVQCESSEYEPERCRDAYAGKGLVQRCEGMPMASTTMMSIWGEVWCLPHGTPADVALPATMPAIERTDDGNAFPKIPPGFVDPPPLTPAIDSPPPAPEPPPPAPPPPPEPAPPPPQAGCGCNNSSAFNLLAVLLPFLAHRRRRNP